MDATLTRILKAQAAGALGATAIPIRITPFLADWSGRLCNTHCKQSSSLWGFGYKSCSVQHRRCCTNACLDRGSQHKYPTDHHPKSAPTRDILTVLVMSSSKVLEVLVTGGSCLSGGASRCISVIFAPKNVTSSLEDVLVLGNG